ncbi:hypothetical protein CsatA_015485 [Cannabis sativa]
MWRAISGCLPTRDRLSFVAEKMCPLCDLEFEIALHIFWECHCARALWFGSPFSWTMGSVPGSANTVKGRIEWMLSSLPSDLTSHYLKFTGCLFDKVWKARNEVLFKSKLIIITEIRCSIMRRFSEAIVEVEADGQVCKIQDTRRAGGKFDAATEVLCVSDASWKDGEAGLAVGLLHIRENRVLWFARKDKAESAAEAEMMAILWGMQLAAAKEFKSIAIASDAMATKTSTFLTITLIIASNIGFIMPIKTT